MGYKGIINGTEKNTNTQLLSHNHTQKGNIQNQQYNNSRGHFSLQNNTFDP